jgi:hypothetical protein
MTVDPRRPAMLVPLLLACAAPRPAEPTAPDERALAMETLVKARRVELVLSARWRPEARFEAIRVEEAPGVQLGRGSAVLVLRALRIEAQEVRLKWLEEGENLLLYAEDVELFRQHRAQPYESRDLSAVTMANDQVSFFQQ